MKESNSQNTLFNNEYKKDPDWKKHWKYMPEYNNMYLPDAEITATFKFRSREDYEEFKELIKEKIYNGERVFDGMQKKHEKSAWYPPKEKASKYEYRDKS